MSHATVLVITKDKEFSEKSIDEMMRPYEEQVSDDDERAVFNIKISANEVKYHCNKIILENKTSLVKRNLYDEYTKLLKAQEYNEIIDSWYGYSLDDNGNYGYYSNPNAKWDWYQLGGRWTGLLKLRDKAEGTVGKKGLFTESAEPDTADSALVKDIDPDWLKNLATYAVLNEHGWHEKSRLGWWGISTKSEHCPIKKLPPIIDNSTVDDLMSNEWFNQKYKDRIKGLLEKYYIPKTNSWERNTIPADKDIEEETWFDEAYWDSNYYKIFIEHLDPETRLSVVDYHI